MTPKTRLDPVVKLREREEEAAKIRLAEAMRTTAAARDRLDAARRAAAADHRTPGPAASWDIEEAAHGRALLEVKRREAELERALAEEERVRAAYADAHRSAEAVRRVRETRREELRAEAARRERKELDEIGAIRFSHRK